jgi:phytanoyl-CoA dioxygenase PhyH
MIAASELRHRFRRDGFVHLQRVFDAGQSAGLRGIAEEICRERQNGPSDCDDDPLFGTSRSDVLARFPRLRWTLLHPPLRESLSALLGEPVVVIPETALHKNFFSNWHRDTGSPRRDKQDFYLQPDFAMLQCAIYLQDNSPELGGGLDVIPGSHKDVALDRFEDGIERMASALPGWARFPGKVLRKIGALPRRLREMRRQPVTVPVRVGDVILFDVRVTHRATQPRPGLKRDIDKFALFYLCSADTEAVDSYVTYIRDVRDYAYMKSHSIDPQFREDASRIGYRVL